MLRSYSVLHVTPLLTPNLYSINDADKENEPIARYETIGGILQDTKYAWTANGPYFTVYNAKTGIKIAAWSFGAALKTSVTKIVCVDELHQSGGKLPLLIIGLDSELNGGIICIFDITGSRILQTVEVGEEVTSLHVINGDYDKFPLPGPLHDFDGILAVGTLGGDVLLVDLYQTFYEVGDEVNNCYIKTISLSEVHSIELQKQIAIKNGERLTVHLNAYNSVTPHFVLKGPHDEDRVHVNKKEVKVSALHYCPQLGSLLVGYNFGAWQLWNLIKMKLVYTSPVYEENIPVSHFALQEPCDDPRAFCYIWAVYSNVEGNQRGFPVAVLYSLNYDSKEWHEGYGMLYQDLVSCAVRFQTDLTLLDGKENENIQQGARCLRLQAINKSISKGSSLQEHQEETLTLCSITWRGWRCLRSNIVTYTYMSLFDLNQWYKEQMPSSLSSKECANYITHVCLSKLLQETNKEPIIPFLDARLDVNTLSQFFGSQKLEEHYYPSSLAFQLYGLREKDIVLFNNQGNQRALLSQLELNGPIALIKPEELFKESIDLGLHPLFVDIPITVTIEYQREFLLNIGLEQQLLGWLCRCATVWSNGNHVAVGCSLQFLLNWGWERAHVLKQNANRLSVPLFDYSGIKLDANTHSLLSNCSRQLKNLATLFGHVVNKFSRFVLNPDIIKQQWESLQMVSVHLDVLQWLLNVGLLPECPLSSYPRADEYNRISAPYPVDDLIDYYNKRRTQLQSTNKEQFSTSGSLLFIDNLIELECGSCKLQKQWENDGGNGLYPPPSLQALLRTYLIEDIDISVKHCVVVYVFLDLAMTLDQSRYKPVITHLIKFPAVFQLSPSIIKITQAFWQLDHADFTTAMEQLLDPLVSTEDLRMWHHRIALRSLLAQNQHNYALLYLQVRQPPITEVQDLCTVLSLYITNNMLDEAFHFQRQNRSSENEGKLLHHFYNECDKKGDISSILYLTLTKVEEEAFMKYLQDVKHPRRQDLQIFYYVQRSQYMEAFELNDKFNVIKSGDRGLKGQANVGFRDMILKEYADSLPEISKSLISLCKKEKHSLWKQVDRPEPFSVFVHNPTEKIKYKSTLIHAVLSKAKETWTHPVLNKTTKNDSLIRSTTEEIPFLNTPKATVPKSRTATPMIFPRIAKLNESRHGDDGPLPAKRLKVFSRSCLMTPERSVTMKSDNNVSVKLDTPLIKRRTSKRSSSLRLSNERFTLGTPQSILKVSNLMQHPQVLDDIESPALVNNMDIYTRESYDSPSGVGESVTNIEKLNSLSKKRSSLGLTPRKPLSSRLAVRFDISRASSESSLTSNTSGPAFEIIEDQAVVHTSISELKQSNVEGSSKNSTLSTDEEFYSPETSISSNTESVVNKPNSKLEKTIVSTVEALKENKSYEESPRTRQSLKRQLQDVPVEVEKPFIKETVTNLLKTPKSRKSYRGSLLNVGVRSSPRLRKSLINNEKEDSSSDSPVNIIHESTLRSRRSPSRESSSTDQPAILSEDAEHSSLSSPYKSKLKGRRSLSRQVLENNTFSQSTSSKSQDLSGKSFEYSKIDTKYESFVSNEERIKESVVIITEKEEHTNTVMVDENKTVEDEVLYTRINTKYESFLSNEEEIKESAIMVAEKEADRDIMMVDEDKTVEDEVLYSRINTKYESFPSNEEEIKESVITVAEKEADRDTVMIDENKTVEDEELLKNETSKKEDLQLDDYEVSSTDISYNQLDVAHVSDSMLCSTTASANANNSNDNSKIAESIEITNNKENEDENKKEDMNILITTEDGSDSNRSTPIDNYVTINCAQIFSDLSSDKSKTADPQLNVFETAEEADLNKGVYIEDDADMLEIDTDYSLSANEDEIQVYQSEFFSNEEYEIEACERNIEDSTNINEEEKKSNSEQVEVIEINSSSSNNSENEDNSSNSNNSENADELNDNSNSSDNSENEDELNDSKSNISSNNDEEEEYSEKVTESSEAGSSSCYASNEFLNLPIQDTENNSSKSREHIEEGLTNNVQLGIIPEETSDVESVGHQISKSSEEEKMESSSSNSTRSGASEEENKMKSSTSNDTKLESSEKENKKKSSSLDHIKQNEISTERTTIVEKIPNIETVKDVTMEIDDDTSEKSTQNILSGPDILDATECRSSIYNKITKPVSTDILEKTELCTPRESLNLLNKTDILDSTNLSSAKLDKNFKDESSTTPARHTRRSSLQTSSDFKRITRRRSTYSNSHSDEQSKNKFDCSTPRESLNIFFNRTDILEMTGFKGFDNEASTSSKAPDILEQSESCSSTDNIDKLQRVDILESTLEKEDNSASSSLQPTPILSALRTRRSNSVSTPSTSKNDSKVTISTPKRKRSTSVDIKEVPLRKRVLRSNSVDIDLKVEEAKSSPKMRSDVNSEHFKAKIRDCSVHLELFSIENLSKRDNEGSTPIKRSYRSKSVKSDDKKPKQPRKAHSAIDASINRTTLDEYSSSRRLTRRQADLLKKTLNSSGMNLELPLIKEEQIGSESDDSEDQDRGPAVDKIDPIKLLDKTDFEGKPDPDEQKNIKRSPSSTSSGRSRRLRSHSSISNVSPTSEDSHSVTSRTKSVKGVLTGKYSTKKRRSRSQSTKSEDKSSPPKLRRTRRGSKESESGSDVSQISKVQSLVETKTGEVMTIAKRTTRSNSIHSDQSTDTVESPLRRSERRSLLPKSELPKIDEESSMSKKSSRKKSSAK